MNYKSCLIAMLVFLLGGTLLPRRAVGQDYILFVASIGVQGQIYNMDGNGNLGFIKSSMIPWGSLNSAVSPDGRVVGFGGPNGPSISLFFIHDDGSISDPLNFTEPCYNPQTVLNQLGFHKTLPLLYVGHDPISIYNYSTKRESVEWTSQTMVIDGNYSGPELSYSPWANSLLFMRATGDVLNKIQTLKLNTDGSFGSLMPTLQLPHPLSGGYFTVSPDGRWAAFAGMDDPQLSLIGINQDGSIKISDTINMYGVGACEVRFMPDNQHLLFLGEHELLTYYEIDQERGKLVSKFGMDRLGENYTLACCIGISPDGRFAAFRSESKPLPSSHNLIHIVRIHEDGQLEYLPDKTIDVPFYVGNLVFATLPHNAARDWMMYE